MTALIYLICGHYLADFGLQNDFTAKFKAPGSAPFWLHVMVSHCAIGLPEMHRPADIHAGSDRAPRVQAGLVRDLSGKRMSNPIDGDTFLPTGTCFEDCTLKFGELYRIHRDNTTLFLVHGICLMEDGEPYSHAWIEWKGKAFQSAIRKSTGEKVAICRLVEDFHKDMRVQECTRYTLPDLMGVLIKFGDIPPPWEPKYRRLTREAKRAAKK